MLLQIKNIQKTKKIRAYEHYIKDERKYFHESILQQILIVDLDIKDMIHPFRRQES